MTQGWYLNLVALVAHKFWVIALWPNSPFSFLDLVWLFGIWGLDFGLGLGLRLIDCGLWDYGWWLFQLWVLLCHIWCLSRAGLGLDTSSKVVNIAHNVNKAYVLLFLCDPLSWLEAFKCVYQSCCPGWRYLNAYISVTALAGRYLNVQVYQYHCTLAGGI